MEFPPTESERREIPKESIGITISNLEVNKSKLKTKPDLIEKILSPMKMKKKMSLQEFEEIQGSVIENFRNLDIFSKVEFVTDLDSPAKLTGTLNVDVKLNLTEKTGTDVFVIKTNIEPEGTPSVQLKKMRENAFGRCEKFDIGFKTASTGAVKISTWDIQASFFKPFLLWDRPNQSLLVSLNQSREDYDMSGYKEDDIKFGMYFYQGALPGTHSSRKWSYELAHRNVECSKFANEKILPEGGPNVKSSISHNWNYDSRDNSVMPTTGGAIDLTTEVAGFGGDVCHLKQTSNFAKSFSLGYGGVTLSTGLRTGIHVPILSKSYISDRFFLGGVDTFRGFEQRGFGPRSVSKCENKNTDGNFRGSDLFFLSSVDVNVPIAATSMGEVKFQLFTQAGNATIIEKGDTVGKALSDISDYDKLRVVIGAGIVWNVPGMLRFELNFNCPLKYQNSDARVSGLQWGVGSTKY